MGQIYKAIYRRADQIQAISNFLKDRAIKYGYRGQIDVVPNGVAWFVDPSGPGQHRRDSYVVSVSRLTKKNGLEDLIRAMPRVESRELVIVGGGGLKNRLGRLVRDLGLTQRVKFIGSVDYRAVHEYLRDASVFVRPSLSEGLGSAFLEAMADRVPVIATPVGGIPDFLIEGQTGWFCRVKDPKSIAEKINFILDSRNTELVNRVVDNANKMVRENYQWGSVARRMEEIFKKI